MLKTFLIYLITKFKANLKLIILQNNKLVSIKDMDQNLLKVFRSILGFNQYDITLTKEQLELKSIMDAFEGEI